MKWWQCKTDHEVTYYECSHWHTILTEKVLDRFRIEKESHNTTTGTFNNTNTISFFSNSCRSSTAFEKAQTFVLLVHLFFRRLRLERAEVPHRRLLSHSFWSTVACWSIASWYRIKRLHKQKKALNKVSLGLRGHESTNWVVSQLIKRIAADDLVVRKVWPKTKHDSPCAIRARASDGTGPSLRQFRWNSCS